jgi:antitoxin YefM
MKTANYTELRNNLKTYLDNVIIDSEPLIVSRQGNNGIVIISLDEYNAIKETEYIMSSPETMAAIHRGENELKQGEVYSQNPDESINSFLERMACIE